jgi:Spy/CpxP family protein refolding chaperone
MNRMARMGAIAVVSVCVAAGMAAAAGPGEGPKPGRGMGGGMEGGDGRILRLLDSAKFAKEAGVSQAQVAEIKSKLEVLRLEQVDLRAELEKAGMQQAKLISEKSMDEEALLAAVDKTSGIHAKIARNRIKQLLVVRKILTPEQSEKLYGMIEQRMGRQDGEGGGEPGESPRKFGKPGRAEPAPAKEAGGPAVVPAEPAKPVAPAVSP